jgi:hypothetical protein
MIQDVDRSVEALLKLELGNPLPFDLSFAMPDDLFGPVSNARPTLNCYLYDIREHRDLRSTEIRLQRNVDGTYSEEPAPARVRVSYCITAWSPAQANAGISPVADEHQLLGRVLRALLRHPVLPAPVLIGTLVGQQPSPCTTIILPDPIKSASDFWTAVHGKLRPSLDYSVTIAMSYRDVFAGPLVTGLQATAVSGLELAFGDGDELFIAGGVVHTNAVPPLPVDAAWVRVTETGGTYVTNAQGQFVIDRLARGTYTLTARAVGYQEGNTTLRVPNETRPATIELVPL